MNLLSRGVADFFQRGGVALALEILISIACNEKLAHPTIHWTGNAFGVCAVKTEVTIPSILFRPEMRAVLNPYRSQMPDTIAMSNNRLELGKLIVRLESIETPQGKQTLESIKRFDDQSKITIRSIGKFNYAVKLTADTSIDILEGLIDAFDRASSKPKSSNAVNQIMSFQQDHIDAWVDGFQRQLLSLYDQTTTVQEDLDACEAIIKQLLTNAGVAIAHLEKYLNNELPPETEISFLAAILLGASSDLRDVRPSVLQAIDDFGSLVRATMQAQEIVVDLSRQLLTVMEGIQAAYRYPDRMLVIDMAMKEKVDMAIGMLKKLKQDVERREIEPS